MQDGFLGLADFLQLLVTVKDHGNDERNTDGNGKTHTGPDKVGRVGFVHELRHTDQAGAHQGEGLDTDNAHDQRRDKAAGHNADHGTLVRHRPPGRR